MSQARASGRHPLVDWWHRCVIDKVDHRAVIEQVHEESGWSAHFTFMTLMSAGIAVLGLLLSSPAVVIGAMLISPLMGPIVGFGFGLALFDFADVRRSMTTLALGILMAMLFCALIVALSPLQTVTSEIAARTRPNLFDLMVAVFAGLAGTYATIRGRQGAIVGVAIAVALMPPLAVMGFGLATFNWTVLWGSTFLFFTNLMAIGVMAALLARLYGFGHQLSPRQTGLQATLVLGTILALAIPLGLALRQIAWEAVAAARSQEIIAGRFGGHARVDQVVVDYEADPIRVSAAVFTPTFRPAAEAEAERLLAALLGRTVEVDIEQFRVATEGAEASQLAAARSGAAAEQRTGRLAARLALVAGVSPDAVLIDRAGERAVVRAARLPGAGLAAYRAMEQRVAVLEPGWRIELIPPAAPLPEVSFDGAEPDEAGREAIATAIWGARRLRLGIGIGGGGSARAEAIASALAEAGVAVERIEGAGDSETVRLTWLAPAAPGE